MKNPKKILEDGRSFLDPVLAGHGYSWSPGKPGIGSGGRFAFGEYVRGNRRLEIHFRYTLGLVSYHVGSEKVDHQSYMRALLGPGGDNLYPGISIDPLDGFRHLAHDLNRFCITFLEGSDAEFGAIVRKAAEESQLQGIKRLP